jgi:hypothetical protein
MNKFMLLLLLVLGVLRDAAQKIDTPGYMDSIKAFRADSRRRGLKEQWEAVPFRLLDNRGDLLEMTMPAKKET